MPFQVGNGCFPAAISDSRITRIARSDTPPEISVWAKTRAFFSSTSEPEALECIRKICHPPAGTTRDKVVGRFEQLRTLAYGGFKENIQSGRHRENHFCILDENSREMLSVTLDEGGKYTLKCQGHHKTHSLTPDTEHAAATTAPQTTKEYEAVWSAWERDAPPEEARDRDYVVRLLCQVQNLDAVPPLCLLQNNHPGTLKLSDLNISSLPDHLPPCINCIQIDRIPLTSLPALPDGLTHISIKDTPLTSLPALPDGLTYMNINTPHLTSLPALPDGLMHISIKDTLLTSLPALPHGLTELTVVDTPLSNLPSLPDRLRCMDISETSLTQLPELPDGLMYMNIENTPLTSLPVLPDRLKKLEVRDTDLTSLPALPHGLTNLMVSKSPLTSLPALPDSLNRLDISETSLTELPKLPVRLNMLFINACPLTSLPALPNSLTRMMINNTSLTHLPRNIINLPPHAIVDISNNPLSERTRQDLVAMTSPPGYQGPRIEFNMAGPSVPRKARPLHLAVADWLTPANKRMPASTSQWQAFGQENDAVSFSAFLDRLSETENAKKDADFKAQISSWLTQLAEDNELRAKTFAMATEATSSCEDRATLALNQMKNVQLTHNAEKGEYDNNLPGLVSAGREMFRLETLEKIARDKVSTLRFVDEIEVYLGYQNKLKEPLELTSVTREMLFFGVSGITESDLQTAERQVKTAENNQFREWILQWAPLRSVLERTESERWEALREKKIADYDDTFRMLSDTELKPAGLVGNTDAERIIGARAMESTEQAFQDGLRTLVDNLVGKYLKARWP